MEKAQPQQWKVWVDRGGTFTDLVARDPEGQLHTHKLLSENPGRYADAAVQGIRELLGLAAQEPIPAGWVAHVKMGTTVATNALLERKGEPLLYVTTQGLGDLLRIGYQNRPDLFARHIQLPEMLYQQVLEVPERISAQGEVVQALDLAVAREGLQQAWNSGIRSVAINFMHAYRFPEHEQQVAALAEEIGFTQISASHRVSPLMKVVSRGDTTVVDAYLSPILKRYVQQVEGELNQTPDADTRLMFMQSNGGLTDAHLFQGKDAILSGPAGGVVGMVKTAEQAGHQQLIGFDMGGTSTDVTHYAGEYERSFETQVAGIRMRAPMMHIHTVAAGGGSILHYDGARFRVGPDSAGADPGPACYRRGGPLSVTDCNVMLGKIQAQHFPSVFGPEGNQPLDVETVRAQFAELAARIGDGRSAEEVAEGFLRIAVENMANAIKQISVQRGYDVTQYVLNCFGGAGGQHACSVADALGMTRVFLHPLAGVLSAYGMGLADVRALREQQIEALFDEQLLPRLENARASLAQDAAEAVTHQGIPASAIHWQNRVHLRYQGSDTALLVPLGTLDAMQRDFEAQHQQRFGFIAEGQALVAEALSVEAIGESDTVTDQTSLEDRHKAEAIANVPLYAGGQWCEALLYDRSALASGQRIHGPAIIIEKTGTNVVEPGWCAEPDAQGNLLLERVVARAHENAVGTTVDPVMLEVFNNLFMSIAEQMGATLANTAHSVNIKERLDFSCAIFDPQGQLVANAPHMPVHLGSMGESIKTVIRDNQGRMHPGDVFMLNAPYNGGTHLPDVTVITPVFDEHGKEVLFYVGSRGHHADIGGRTPGSSPPDSQHIEEEGVLIDNFLLMSRGQLRERETLELLRSGPYPCRNPEQNITDLTAQVAANNTGVRELQKMIAHFGLDVVQAYMGHVQDNAEESVRRVLDVLNDGAFDYPLDNGSRIRVAIAVDKQRRRATVDFSGTSAQSSGNYNAPLAVCKAAVLYVFRTLVDDDIPLNEGCLKPLNIVVPENSMINPSYPAAVIAGNTEVSQCITDALYGALGVLASAQGTMNNFVYGDEVYQNYETICGGTGAGHINGVGHAGTSAVQSHMTNTRMTDPEVLEWRYPVRLEEFSIRRGSGGRGAFNGGDGVVRKLKFLAPLLATTLSSHRNTDPYGLNGGEAGARGENSVIKTDGSRVALKGNDEYLLSAGDVFEMKTPGGGGFGAPN